MGGWESLRVDLQRVLVESPGAFLFGPNPDSERRYEKRIRIGLAAWAAVSATLDFGADPTLENEATGS